MTGLDWNNARLRSKAAKHGSEHVDNGFPQQKRKKKETPKSVTIKMVIYDEKGITARAACERVRSALKDSGLVFETGEMTTQRKRRR